MVKSQIITLLIGVFIIGFTPAAEAGSQYSIPIPELHGSLAVQNFENVVALLARGKLEKTKELLRTHLSTYEELVPVTRVILGYLYLLHGSELERSISVFENVLDQHQELPETMAAAHTGMGLVNLSIKAFPEKTIRHFQKVAELPLNHFYDTAVLAKSEALVFLRRYREAVEALESVSSFVPGMETHPGLYGASDEALYESARIKQFWLRDYQGALKIYQDINQKFIVSVFADWGKLYTGVVSEIIGSFLGGRLAYEKHYEFYVNSLARKASARGLKRIREKNTSKTLFLDLEELERTIRNEFREAFTIFNTGSRSAVDYRKSIAALKQLIFKFPATPEAGRALNKIAIINHFFLQQTDVAREAWKLVLDKYPGTRVDHMAAFFLALTSEAEPDGINQAVTAYSNFVKHYPHSPLAGLAYLRLAVLKLQIPYMERETLNTFNECAKHTTDLAPLANFLSGLLIHFKVGEKKSALPYYQSIVENYFHSGFADEALFLIGVIQLEEAAETKDEQLKSQAQQTLQELITTYPGTPYITQVNKMLEMLSDKQFGITQEKPVLIKEESNPFIEAVPDLEDIYPESLPFVDSDPVLVPSSETVEENGF
ncbi:MAG: tetratricopeptide repeat protein [bacterium]|jgi:tetratricopeptide (TPR) repeat protein|nr:tetratricopeptide repeat protein [bacterium]